MNSIAISSIHIPPNRQRLEFDADALQELTDSISKAGLLQPIVVRTSDDNRITLVAGERRLRAVVDLQTLGGVLRHNDQVVGDGEIPVVYLGSLNEVDAFEAELEENIRRMDLTWQERASAVAALHSLRLQQRPESHTVKELAQELHGRSDGDYSAKTKQALIVAEHLDDSDVRGAKTAKDAYKIILAKETANDHQRRAALVGKTFGAHLHRAIQGNCLEVMGTFPDRTFDVVCTDPPYGMGADSFGDAAGKLLTIDHQYDDSLGSFESLMTAAIREISRVCKPAAHLYICCDIDQFHWLKTELMLEDWNVFRTPLINEKVGSGRVPLPEHGPRRTYETILYAFRGGKPVTGIYPDVMHTTGDDNLGHGAQKPVELYTELLKRSVRPGDKVLDPFAGTGTVFPAAHSLSCEATGIEMEPQYFGIAVKRIEELG